MTAACSGSLQGRGLANRTSMPSRDGSERRARRISTRAAGDTIDLVTVQQGQLDDEADEQWVKQQIHKNPAKVKVCKAALMAIERRAVKKVEPLRRGIRTWDTVPDKMMVEVLSRIKKKPTIVFDNWDVLNVRWTFWMAMGGNPGMSIEKGMMPEQFFSYCLEWYESNGRPIDDMDVDEEPDWETKDGEYSLVTDDPESDDPLFTKMRCRRDGTVVTLPEDFHIFEHELGDKWQMVDPYSVTQCILKNIKSKKLQFCQGFWVTEESSLFFCVCECR